MPDVELNAKDVSPDSSDSLTPEPSLVPRSKVCAQLLLYLFDNPPNPEKSPRLTPTTSCRAANCTVPDQLLDRRLRRRAQSETASRNQLLAPVSWSLRRGTGAEGLYAHQLLLEHRYLVLQRYPGRAAAQLRGSSELCRRYP